jgi:transcriptional regulator with PAS, ATPase and Fis domain
MEKMVRLRKVVRELVREALINEKRAKRRDPGGPRTDTGALRQLEPNSFVMRVRSVMADHEGDVEKAAEDLGVAPRTLYYYLDDETALRGVKTASEREDTSREKERPEEDDEEEEDDR